MKHVACDRSAICPPDQFSIIPTYEIKFFDRIRGALTAAPTSELPVKKIPQAAPTMDKPRPKATPKDANPYGDMWERT